MSGNKYNAQRQGNEQHVHTQDEKDKAALKESESKAKQKSAAPVKGKKPAKS